MEQGRVRWFGGVLGALFGIVAALPSSALPPEENESWVELGTWINSDDSFKFGDYTGLDENGVSLLANFDVSRRAVWDSGDVRWWRAQGQNLGLDSRFARGDLGYQGLFNVWFQYEEIPKFQTDTATTVFLGRGTDTLTLRPSWIASGTTPGFRALNSNLRELDIDHIRRTASGGFGLQLPYDLEWVGDYEYQSKQGRKLVGAVIGNSGGNPRSAIVPEPIDYQTNEGETALRWNGEHAQLQLGYEISVFNDSNSSLTWQNPFSQVNGWQAGAGVGYPTGYGRKSTPPDNSFNQISMTGGMDLPWNTRVSGDVAYGWMRQNQDFLPYTVNPLIADPIPPPRGDADAQIDTTAATLRISSHPIDKLRLDANVRYDDRDNETPRGIYQYVAGDALNQQPLTATQARINMPNSYTLVQGRLEAGYEIYDRTELAVGYQRTDVSRTFTEVDETNENTIEGTLRSRPLSWLQMRIEGAYADRNGTEYMYQSPLFESFTQQHIATLPPDQLFENNPFLRRNNYANRNRSSIVSRFDVMPLDTLSLGLDTSWIQDEYQQSTLGLTERQAMSTTGDVSWSPLENFTTYAWFTYENLKSNVDGRAFSTIPDAFNPTHDWWETDEDDVYTAGVGAELHLLHDRLTLRTDYVYSLADTSVDVNTGPGLAQTTRNFPDIKSRLNDWNVSAEYKVLENLAFRVTYLLEDLKTQDWAYDGVGQTTIQQVLGAGEQMPNYRNHLIGVSVRYEFR